MHLSPWSVTSWNMGYFHERETEREGEQTKRERETERCEFQRVKGREFPCSFSFWFLWYQGWWKSLWFVTFGNSHILYWHNLKMMSPSQRCGIINISCCMIKLIFFAEAGHASKCFIVFQIDIAMNGSNMYYMKYKIQVGSWVIARDVFDRYSTTAI